MAFFGENWDDADYPLAYLITIRTFGTWLHGDEKFSVDTHGDYNVFGAPKRPRNPDLHRVMAKNRNAPPVKFNRPQGIAVHEAIQGVCHNRGYELYALNVRATHGHAVIRAETKPEIISDSFKAYATRGLREKGLISNEVKPWSRGRSRRYLWKPNHVDAAIDYVLYCQGDDSFEDWYILKFPGQNT